MCLCVLISDVQLHEGKRLFKFNQILIGLFYVLLGINQKTALETGPSDRQHWEVSCLMFNYDSMGKIYIQLIKTMVSQWFSNLSHQIPAHTGNNTILF